MSRLRRYSWPVLAITLLLIVLVSPASAATSIEPDVWDPGANPSPDWVNGNIDYYTEGEVAPIRLLVGDADGTVVTFSVCLDLTVASNGHYGFSDITLWDTDYTPTVQPPDPNNLSAAIGGFQIENGTGTLDSVTFVGLSDGTAGFECLEDYQEWAVQVTLPTNNDGNDETAVVVFGAIIAKPGDPVASGGFVPAGLGAGGVNGVFQFEVRNGGRQAINFTANEAPSTLIVDKVTDPADDPQLFDFNVTDNNGTDEDFQLADATAPEEFVLDPGDYTITEENIPANWDLTDITCDFNANAGSSVTYGTTDVDVTLGQGDTITCTFTNTYTPPPAPGTIVIVKDAEPADDTSFTFTQNIDQTGNFNLSDPTTPSKTFSDVAAGAYAVAETDTQGWKLSEIECDDLNSTTNGSTATINVEAGETVTCTFKNYKPLNLTSLCSNTDDVREWRVTNPNPFDVNYEVQLQTTTDATPNRVATPGLSFFTTVAVAGPNTTKIVYTDPFGNEQQVTKASSNALCPPQTGFCPVDPDVAYELTDLIGRGMGSPTKAVKRAKLVVPNAGDLTGLYGQLTAVDIGIMKWVRFANGSTIQINAPTSPAFRTWAVDWWGTELEPGSPIKGAFFTGKNAAKAPRGMVLWPTYATDEEYANVFMTFDDSFTNHVYWNTAEGWDDEVVQTVAIPETQAAGADITVKVALVDNQPDDRPVVLTVTPLPGGTPVQMLIFGPNVPGKPAGWQNTLNLETIVLENVPAGTNAVEVRLMSPGPNDPEYQTGGQGGDSVGMIGAAVSYPCVEEVVPTN